VEPLKAVHARSGAGRDRGGRLGVQVGSKRRTTNLRIRGIEKRPDCCEFGVPLAVSYNYSLSPRTEFLIQAPLVGAEQVAKKGVFSLRGLIVSFAILALTVSLANRTVHLSFSDTPRVHSSSPDAKIQHCDKDHSGWISPIAKFVVSFVIEPSLTPSPTNRVVVALNYDSLYNRPPPIS